MLAHGHGTAGDMDGWLFHVAQKWSVRSAIKPPPQPSLYHYGCDEEDPDYIRSEAVARQVLELYTRGQLVV